jgi:endonuclease YncB( thermonuclease family)
MHKHFDSSPEFAEAERKARETKLGLWADTQEPIAPWDFREQQKQKRKAGNRGN